MILFKSKTLNETVAAVSFYVARNFLYPYPYPHIQKSFYFLNILPLIYKNIAIDVVEKERKRRGGKHYQASMMHMIFGGNPGSSKRRRIIH